MISISTLWAVIIACIGLVLTIVNIIDKIAGLRDRARRPDDEQDAKIAALEEWQRAINMKLDEHDRYFAADKARIEHMEQNIRHSNKIIMQSLRALSSHALDGNNIEQLKESTKALDEYLLDR